MNEEQFATAMEHILIDIKNHGFPFEWSLDVRVTQIKRQAQETYGPPQISAPAELPPSIRAAYDAWRDHGHDPKFIAFAIEQYLKGQK